MSTGAMYLQSLLCRVWRRYLSVSWKKWQLTWKSASLLVAISSRRFVVGAPYPPANRRVFHLHTA